MDERIGPYTLAERIGRGGMGTVYLARDQQGREVAVKVINSELADDPTFRDRFRREVTAARSVRRFCTASVLDAQLDAEPLYVVTEYVPGPDLDAQIRKNGPLHGSSLEHLAVGVATALGAIHAAGIVHRDLKPANVLLSPVGPRVIDFGIARALDSVSSATRTGQMVGTPAYMAPELIQGADPTPAADVWAWGCVIAYAGTGRAPFSGPNVPAVLMQVLQGEPQLDGLDPAVRPLVEAALAKDPARRPAIRQLLERLTGQTVIDSEQIARTVQANWTPPPTVLASGPTLPDAGAPPRRRGLGRRHLLVGAGAAVALLAVAGTALFALRGGEGVPESGSYAYDNFSSTDAGWSGISYTDGTTSSGYRQGKYRMEGRQYRMLLEEESPFKVGDQRMLPARSLITAKLRMSGSRRGAAGLFCFGPEPSEVNGYLVLVSADGSGLVIRRKLKDAGDKDVLRAPSSVPGFKAGGENLFQVACERRDGGRSARIRLWINGEKAAEVVDDENPVTEGNGGFVVAQENWDSSGAMIVDYDDFQLARLK